MMAEEWERQRNIFPLPVIFEPRKKNNGNNGFNMVSLLNGKKPTNDVLTENF